MGLTEMTLSLCLISGLLGGVQDGAAIQTARAELQATAEALRSAAARGDAETVATFFDDQFMYVHSTGGIDTRDDYVAKLLADAPRAAQARQNEVVHVVGDVVTLRWDQPSPVSAGARLFGSAIYAKRGGRWQALLMQETQLAPPQASIVQSAERLDRFVGVYATSEGNRMQVKRQGTRLLLLRPSRAVVILLPQSDHEFVVKGGQAKVTFGLESGGRVTRLVLSQPGGASETGHRTSDR